MIKVAVCGACGKMGQEVVKAVLEDESLKLVAKIDICGEEEIFATIEQALQFTKIDVLVDFTQPKSIFENSKLCLKKGICPVIGTTGLSDIQIEELKKISQEKNVSCLIAPNFSTGAVLMMMFSAQAAKYFDNVEIIELHHNQKKDAPSGTAVKTAKMMSEAKATFAKGNCEEVELIQGSRGGTSYSDIHIHSVRMPGYIASQEVIFGSSGQVFKLRHDSMDRACYMSGVILAIKHVINNNDFIYGLENIL
jgi:4-hydroxy-tetrahydrodipicolinate reductase